MNREIAVRVATMADLDNVLHLFELLSDHHESLDPTHNADWHKTDEAVNYFTKRIQQGTVWIAARGNDPIGYLAGRVLNVPTVRTLTSLAEIQNMFVMDAYRGQGIGSRLIAQFCAWCSQQGVTQIKVEALSINPKAIEFYRRLGFGDYVLTLERAIGDE